MITATLILLIVVVTMINVIMVNNFVMWIYDEFSDYADPATGRVLLRICLVPPIGIAVTALATACIAIAWIIMTILEIWNRDSN